MSTPASSRWCRSSRCGRSGRCGGIRGSLEALRDDPSFEPMLDDYAELTLDPPVSVGNPQAILRERWRRVLSFRNEVVPTGGALVRVEGDGQGPRDLAADWDDFDRQFPGGSSSPELRREAFASLLAQFEQAER